MPDTDLLDAKLESLSRCLQRIEAKTPSIAKEFIRDYDAQDIVSVNVQRAIQICVDLGNHLISSRGWKAPGTMAETFSILNENGVLDENLAGSLARAVGFRNVSVHQYHEIDWVRVHRLVTKDLGIFRAFAGAIAPVWNTTPDSQ